MLFYYSGKTISGCLGVSTCDLCQMSQQGRNGQLVQETSSGPSIGTRYIVEDLIRKVSGQNTLEAVTSLNLTLAKDGGKIKYIENLDRLKKLEVLNLGNNVIEKIEKLDKLTHLRELNLSFNCIRKIENLEPLTLLQVLNLTGNLIEAIPLWLTKRLKSLRVFKMAKNRLQSLQELSKLRPLSNLVELTVFDNPVAELPHCRLYIVFHLRTLEVIDRKPIKMEERQEAQTRFAQEELEKLMDQLERRQSEYLELVSVHSKSLQESEERGKKQLALEETSKQLQTKLKELNQELETKSNLLKKKTTEVTKACEKHYALEQELAFYKIDHKFDSLRRPPIIHTPDSSVISDDSTGSLPGESPYIGKSRFRQNEYAAEQHVNAKSSVIQHGRLNGSSGTVTIKAVHMPGSKGEGDMVTSGFNVDSEVLDMRTSVEKELSSKLKTLESVNVRIHEQHAELGRVEDQLARVTEELKSKKESLQVVSRDLPDGLQERISSLCGAQNEARKVESELMAAERDLVCEERNLERLHEDLCHISRSSPQYNMIQNEIAIKEQRVDEVRRTSKMLESLLEAKLGAVASEAEHLQCLDNNSSVFNKELKKELKDAVSGLNSYLTGVREKVELQNEQFVALVRERAQMIERLREVEPLSDLAQQQNAEIARLQQQVISLEESIREVSSVNESLQHELDESKLPMRGCDGISFKLQHAEVELLEAQKALAELQEKHELENRSYLKKLEMESRKVNQLKHRLKDGDAKEQEVHDLHRQLFELQAANVQLQDQLYASQHRSGGQLENSIDSEALRRRLEDVKQALLTYREPYKSTAVSTPRQCAVLTDPVEQLLSELQDTVQKEVMQCHMKVDDAEKAKDKLESKVAALKDEIVQVQHQERSVAERAVRAVYDNEKQQSDIMRNEIKQLEGELDKLLASSGGHHRTAVNSHTSETGSTTSGTASGLSSASGSGSGSTTSGTSLTQWSTVKQELYETMTGEERELFTELQDELNDLRRLLAAKTPADSKIENAKKKKVPTATLR